MHQTQTPFTVTVGLLQRIWSELDPLEDVHQVFRVFFEENYQQLFLTSGTFWGGRCQRGLILWAELVTETSMYPYGYLALTQGVNFYAFDPSTLPSATWKTNPQLQETFRIFYMVAGKWTEVDQTDPHRKVLRDLERKRSYHRSSSYFLSKGKRTSLLQKQVECSVFPWHLTLRSE